MLISQTLLMLLNTNLLALCNNEICNVSKKKLSKGQSSINMVYNNYPSILTWNVSFMNFNRSAYFEWEHTFSKIHFIDLFVQRCTSSESPLVL